MKSPITIDFVNATITVNAAYAKKASNPFSAEYAQIQKVRADYPTFTVRTRSIKKNAAKDSYKGLTYKACLQFSKTQGHLFLIRISDILSLRLSDIVRDGDRYRLEITEQKTKKKRVFTVPLVIQQYIENYCLRNGIEKTERIFNLTERAISKQLALVCDYLGFEGIGTHSFRKWYATEIYKNNGYDITLVQRLLQHSSAAITQRYIGIEPQRIEEAIEGHTQLL